VNRLGLVGGELLLGGLLGDRPHILLYYGAL